MTPGWFHVKRASGARPGSLVAGAYVDDEGSGPAVLLCGGLGGNWFDWDEVAAALVARGLRVLRVDRPGYGLGPAPEVDLDVASEVTRMFRVADICAVNAPAVIVGHSMGAIYAEAFARLYPTRTRALVLLDATVTSRPVRIVPTQLRVRLARRVGKLVSGTVVQRALAARTRKLLTPSPNEEPAQTAAWIRAVYRDPVYLESSLLEYAAYPALARELANLRKIEPLCAPTLVAAAHTDRRTPWGAHWVWRQRGFARFLGARFAVVRPARHHLMIDQPADVAELIASLCP